MNNLTTLNIAQKGDTMGHFQGHPIYQWIVLEDGRMADYSHVSDKNILAELMSGNFISMHPGIVYKFR